jgi:versiconal hemiacetal acetate esterase
MADEGFAQPWIEVNLFYKLLVVTNSWFQFEKELGFRPLLHGPKVDNCFKEWDNLGAALVSKYEFPAPDASVSIEDRAISNGIKVRVYTPSGYAGGKPLGLYIHGGGWAMGDLNVDDQTCRSISKNAGVVLVSVDYRLAPANPYPAGLDDCVEAFRWTLKNATTLGGIADKAFICGASAGGGSSFGLALRMIDEELGSSIAGIVAQVPVTVHPDLVPAQLKAQYTSYTEHAEHTVNSASAMLAFWDAYGAPKDQYANPLLHDKLRNLPKVYITCAGHDTLRDDARLMRDLLQKNGYDSISLR